MPKFIESILRKTSPKLAFKVAVAEYCVKCLTSCETVHREVAENPERIILGGNYFRLNVPQGMSKIGLDEWDKLEDMIALSNSYMTHGDMLKLKQTIAKLLRKPQLASLYSVRTL
jgi:dissimilatory sulfite reductase (desulfoviridin) alpha/beta subunit